MTTYIRIDLTLDQSQAVSGSQYCPGPMRALTVTLSCSVIGQCLLCSDSHVTDRASGSSSSRELGLQPPPTNTCDWGQGSESYVTIQTSYSSHLDIPLLNNHDDMNKKIQAVM